MKYVYEVFARYNGKPAGFYGRYKTRAEAEKGARGRHMSTVIRRESISNKEFKIWADSGYKPWGWIPDGYYIDSDDNLMELVT